MSLLDTKSDMPTPTLEEAKNYIETLDLTYIVKRMSSNPRVSGWTRHEATICSKMYKNYLFLLKKYPGQTIPPSKQIDEFWHEHILHTRQYYSDCLQIFGQYLHHFPGEPSKDAHQEFVRMFDEVTQTLYFSEYGEYL
ncbi:MAG: hypothetical protein K0S08_1026 [Gammaproteobacteria bacterium]|jgi:hypothetical protein|nr:hypothetical protein [Gammaproteobacteria bacterium]